LKKSFAGHAGATPINGGFFGLHIDDTSRSAALMFSLNIQPASTRTLIAITVAFDGADLSAGRRLIGDTNRLANTDLRTARRLADIGSAAK